MQKMSWICQGTDDLQGAKPTLWVETFWRYMLVKSKHWANHVIQRSLLSHGLYKKMPSGSPHKIEKKPKL